MAASLIDVLDVLDRADARAQLLSAVTNVNTDHSSANLAEAVDEHLACTQSSSLMAAGTPYDFGWARPKTEEGFAQWKSNDHGARMAKLSKGATEFSTLAVHNGWVFCLPLGIGMTAITFGSGVVFWAAPLGGVVSGLVGHLFAMIVTDAHIDGWAKKSDIMVKSSFRIWNWTITCRSR